MSEQWTPKTHMEFAHYVIEGVGGMNDFEKYEMAVWSCSERVAAAAWVLKCLANPACEGSQAMVNAILLKRAEAEVAAKER